jgi:decaprenylphospho-beta-D-erythro-pentofuranosid-2-ulose 2-reductase
MKVVVLGATKGMGRALARQLAERGDELFLLGRDPEDLERSARDLEARGHQPQIGVGLCDLAETSSFGAALDAAWQNLGRVEAVIVTAGLFATQAELEADEAVVEKLLSIDFTNTVVFCEFARKRLLGQGGGKLCVLTSVAGDRGRKPVAIYGAAKAGLSRYLEALDHKYRSEGLITIDIKPGFVKTGMTAGLKPPPFAGEPDQVARRVIKALDRGEPLVYAPWPWRFVMLVIRWLPRFVMRRIGF